MGSVALLQSLKEGILGQASVKTIYGEPVSAHGKTIIPVAKVMYGYSAGAGTGGVSDTSARGEGGGGGGGVRVVPLGVVEVSEQQTRFVPISDRRKLTGALRAGIGLGMWLGWPGFGGIDPADAEPIANCEALLGWADEMCAPLHEAHARRR
jgi:uncharacterized spore protein YtfJ